MSNAEALRLTQQVERWLEENVGGEVVDIAMQPRWRPVWFARVQRDGEILEICVRGDRQDARIGFTLEHEMALQQQLEVHGIPVAHVYGWCEEPRAYAMAVVPGVNHFGESTPGERDAVMDDYMRILADVHRLDIAPFAEAGLVRAGSPEDSGRIGMKVYEDAYRAVKKRPDPHLEFCLAWIARNPLRGPVRESVIVWDSGQFHHADGRVQALLDLEIGHIGDPMMDLAGFRMRDSILGYGEFETLYGAYERHSGTQVDRDAIQHHHLCFTLSNQLAFHAALADPPQGSDYMTNMQWCAETNIYAIEALAEVVDVELEVPEVPEAQIAAQATGAAHLVGWLRNFKAEDEIVQHDVRVAFRLARHLDRASEIGAAVADANLDDLKPLLGHRPSTWQQGDADLEAFVMQDDGRHDAELIRLFHRRTHRYLMLLGPEGSAMARHNPIPGFA
ncbi:MAG: phosphotransferase [Myxococcota bacterium]|nr:phosphotransferase [Myxococcota bacterium]